MDSKKLDDLFFYVLLTISALVLGYVALFSVVHYEGSESIFHYFHAAAIGKHPEVIVNHWGKPLFIVLAYPFAYFGEKGVMVFNSLLMLLSAFFSFKIGRKLGFKFSFPLAVLVIYSPVYFRFSQSALTEPLFGLIAVISAYLFLSKKYSLAAWVISFIILSRTEGLLFLPIYAFCLIIQRKYKAIPWLFFGFFAFSFIGYLVGKGFWWYFTDYPYSNSAVSIYGKGPFWNYFINQEHITGTPFSYFIFWSFVLVISSFLFKIRTVFEHKNLVFLGLIVLPAVIYVFGHSYLWYAGKSASVGLYRIVGGVIPLLAILAMFGLNALIKIVPKFMLTSTVQLAILFSCCFFMLKHTFIKGDSVILVQPDAKEELILESIDWIKENGLQDKTMYIYQAHYLAEFEGDHFDRTNSKIKAGLDNREHPEEEMKSGDILIWDGHFSPNEGGINMADLDVNDSLIPLVTFTPENPFEVYGGGTYLIKIFKRK